MDEHGSSLLAEAATTSVSDVVRQVTAVAQRYLARNEDRATVELGEKVLQQLKEFADGRASLRDLNNLLYESDRLSGQVSERTEEEVAVYLERVADRDFVKDNPSKDTEPVVDPAEVEPVVVAEERPRQMEDSFVANVELVPYEEGEGPVLMMEGRRLAREIPEYSFADICDVEITKCKDIHYHPMKYVNVLGQVISVFRTMRSVIIRFWDGHMLKYSKLSNLKLFLAETGIITDVVVPALPELADIPSDYYMDICVYGRWIEDSQKLKSGDIICVTNLHMSLPKTCRQITAVLHEGSHYGRHLRLLSSEDAASDQMVKDLLVTAASLKDRPQQPSPIPPRVAKRPAEAPRDEQRAPPPKPQLPAPLRSPAEEAVDLSAKRAKTDTSPAKQTVKEVIKEKPERLIGPLSAARKEFIRRSFAKALDIDLDDAPSSSEKAANRSDPIPTRKENPPPVAILLDDGIAPPSTSHMTRPAEQRGKKPAGASMKEKRPPPKTHWNVNTTENDLKDLDEMFSSVFGCIPIGTLPALLVADDSPVDVLEDSLEDDLIVLHHQLQQTAEISVQTENHSSTTGTQTKSPSRKHKGVQVVVEEERPVMVEMAVQMDHQVEPSVASPRREPFRSPRRVNAQNPAPGPGPEESSSPRRNSKRGETVRSVKEELLSPPPRVPPRARVSQRRPVPPPRTESRISGPSANLRHSKPLPIPKVKVEEKPKPPPKLPRSTTGSTNPPVPPRNPQRNASANQAPPVAGPLSPTRPKRSSSRLSAAAAASVTVKEEKPLAKRPTPRKNAKNPVSSGFCRTPQIRLCPTAASNAKEKSKCPAEGPTKMRK